VGAVVASIGILAILIAHNPLVNQFAKTPEVAELASSYLVIFTIVIGALAVCQNISVFFYASGKPKLPFYSKVLELPFNAALSYALIYGHVGFPELGLGGAAIGSAGSVLLRAVFLLGCLFYVKAHYLLAPGWLLGSVRASINHHLQNAMPIAGTYISMNLSMTVCMMIYTQLEVFEFAALTILFLWVRTCGQVVTAWCQATGIIVGQLLGRRQIDILNSFVLGSWYVATVLGFIVAVIYALSPVIFKWVYPNLEDQTISVLSALLPLLILMPLVRSSNTICGNVLRAAGQSAYAFKVHVTAQWLFTVPMTALFVLVFELSIFWIFAIYIFEELIKAIPFHVRMLGGEWKTTDRIIS